LITSDQKQISKASVEMNKDELEKLVAALEEAGKVVMAHA